MKKLYKVTIEMMVIANNVAQAKYTAGDADIYSCDVNIEETTKCLPGWEGARPFGDDGSSDATCSEILRREP